LRTFPEVERVFGKAGRALTSTDPAPFSMMETTVILKPEKEWRLMKRWYSGAPRPVRWVLNRFWPERMTWEELVNEMDSAMRLPGVRNAWTMPIKARIDMLTTGVRTPVGIKIFGADVKEIEKIGEGIEAILRDIPATRSIYAERTAAGYFLNFKLKREEIARYGLSVEDVETALLTAVGGENITRTVEGRERYPVNVRYPRELRDDENRLKRVLVPRPAGGQVPLAQLAEITRAFGPSMIRDENGMLAGYVYVDIDTASRDIGSYVAQAKQAIAEKLTLPPGCTLVWSGQYEAMKRVHARLWLVVPITLFIVFILIYMNTQSAIKTFIVLLAVPFSAVGAIWLLYVLGYHMSIAVWVGLIALLGLDAETGIFMLLYLDLAYEEAKSKGLMRSRADLKEAIIHGAVKRVRPKVMTVACAFFGLLPIMWSLGTGADVMKRIAAPMVGGLFTSFIMELLVYPVIYELWKRREVRKNNP
jgi:Cu(I)/Ag(I) efflux system membrane protein CusA/SilA